MLPHLDVHVNVYRSPPIASMFPWPKLLGVTPRISRKRSERRSYSVSQVCADHSSQQQVHPSSTTFRMQYSFLMLPPLQLRGGFVIGQDSI